LAPGGRPGLAEGTARCRRARQKAARDGASSERNQARSGGSPMLSCRSRAAATSRVARGPGTRCDPPGRPGRAASRQAGRDPRSGRSGEGSVVFGPASRRSRAATHRRHRRSPRGRLVVALTLTFGEDRISGYTVIANPDDSAGSRSPCSTIRSPADFDRRTTSSARQARSRPSH
jgi:hypothetical protein